MAIAGKGVFANGKEDYPRWVAGRWPGKAALSIGLKLPDGNGTGSAAQETGRRRRNRAMGR